ncbi:uncharacterized protein LOC126673014 [Mercurialis annua]|uniref:uncharacterized protein LOC126673014 n=1 Tax=Mercurialis annua TaxID=3986 RepID=UPI0024ACEB89|nr:uncharacterized protein LOC126673014 [Mercurialis annua]
MEIETSSSGFGSSFRASLLPVHFYSLFNVAFPFPRNIAHSGSLHRCPKTSSVLTVFVWKNSAPLTLSKDLFFLVKLFESSALMHISAVKSLLSALSQLSHQYMCEASVGFGPVVNQKIGSINLLVERMISILVNNLHRVEPLWDHVVGHFLELANNSNQNLRNMALDALDHLICAVLGSELFQDHVPSRLHGTSHDMEIRHAHLRLLECSVLSPLRALYFFTQSSDVRSGSLKNLLHLLERHGDKLYNSWPNILEMLRSVADAPEKDLVTLGFQSLHVIMIDGLASVPTECLPVYLQDIFVIHMMAILTLSEAKLMDDSQDQSQELSSDC